MSNQTNRSKAWMIAFIATALVAQVLYWVFSMPGPQLRGETGLNSAIVSCLISVATFALIPLLFVVVAPDISLGRLGLGLGDKQFGWKAIVLCTPAMVIGTYIGSRDPEIQSYYPIPGDSVVNSIGTLLVWFAAYGMYYISFELFYRGFMLSCIGDQKTNGPSPRVIWTWISIQAFCCFLIHIGKPNAELFASLPASFLFGWIAVRSGSIWYGFAIHFAVGIVNDLGAVWPFRWF